MKEYLWKLIVASVIYGVCVQLCPGGENGGYGRHIRLLGGVCMLLLLLSPVQALAQGGWNIAGALQDYFASLEQPQTPPAKEEHTQMDANLAAYATKEGLCEAFGLSAQDVTVGVHFDAVGQEIEAISIGLSGQAIWQDSHAIEEWVHKNIGVSAEIYVE